MSMYNLIFGENSLSDAILATLGLTREQCGRFRDCFIEEGKIAVYTRNGGGNRHCWHEDGGGYESCKHEAYQKEVDETVYATKEEIEQHTEWTASNVFCGNKRMVRTGKGVVETFYKCLEPSSEHCSCPGCIISYKLRKHPNYITDRDDDFDCTYATIWFSFPTEYAELLSKLASGEKFDPSQRWIDAINALKSK